MESWSLAVVAALLLAYAGVSHRLERTIVSAAMVFTAAGLLLGPEVLDWLHFDLGSSEVALLAEITLTLVLFSTRRGSTSGPCAASWDFPRGCSASGCP